MKLKKHLLIVLIAFVSTTTFSQEISVSNITEYDTAIKNAKAGNTIILKNGIWEGVKLNAFGNGTKEAPIIIKAETPGEVFITGNSILNIYGEYVIVSGLWFKDGASTYKSVVQFKKDSKKFANNCRLTNCTISYFENSAGLKDHWVDIWGKNNRVDHNNFTGKRSEGTTLVVWLKGEEHLENNHKIEYNLFGERPDLGKNGGETIRVGTSANSMKSSKTIVQKNIFYHCNGEIETISNKSCDNIFTDNLFVESQGTLTLRHGNNALVENNVFLGNKVSKTGGIRVINKGHIIRNNYLIGLAGTGFRGPITVMNGVPNSPLNRYHRVENVDIQNNTIINCGPIVFGAGSDKERTLTPKNVNFANNLVYHVSNENNVLTEDSTSGFNFKNNYIEAPTTNPGVGFTLAKINWKEVKSYLIPNADNPTLLKVSKSENSPERDITKAIRNPLNAGAFNLDAKRLPKALGLRAGPGWKPNIVKPAIKAKVIAVKPGEETLRKAIGKANEGDVLTLGTGEYILEKKIKISSKISIVGDKGGASIIRVKEGLKKPLDYMIRLNGNAGLKISNVIFDGDIENPKYAIVSPDINESELYTLFVDNVIFKNFTNKNGGTIYKAYEGTKADTLSFKNSRFEDSFRGLNLSYDKNNAGAFSANTIIIENTVFNNIEEAAINYFRNTPSPLIPGGKLIVNHCIFNDVYNTEKGKIIRTDGIHHVEIKNSVFDSSYNVQTPVSLKGPLNSIKNCLFHSSGFPKISMNAKQENVISKNPKWEDKELFIPSEKSILLKKNNKRETIGLQQIR